MQTELIRKTENQKYLGIQSLLAKNFLNNLNSKLYIDGEVTSPIIYLEPNHYHYMKNESITRMAKSHLDLYSTYFGGLNYMWKKENGVEYIDYEEFDKSIYDLLCKRNG